MKPWARRKSAPRFCLLLPAHWLLTRLRRPLNPVLGEYVIVHPSRPAADYLPVPPSRLLLRITYIRTFFRTGCSTVIGPTRMDVG